MLRIRDYSITTTLTWMNMLVGGTALLLACGAFITCETVMVKRGMVRNLSVQSQIIGRNCVTALLFNDPESARSTLSALRAAPHITSAWIFNPEGRPFAGYERDRKLSPPQLPPLARGRTEDHWFKDSHVGLVRSVDINEKLTGYLYIQSDLDGLYERLEGYAEISLGVLVPSLLAAFCISWVSGRIIAKPIQDLSETARVVSRHKNFAIRALPREGRDEISELIVTFNDMLAQIQQRDIALQKARDNLEIRVEERTAELAAANQELEAFTYSVSHDLRAPLRRINSFSQIVFEETNPEALSDDVKRYLSYIREGAQEMGRLVDELLNLSRLGRKQLNVERTGLSSLVKEVVDDLKHDNPGRTIKWLIQPLPYVDCDPTLMRQVFVNLLSNAVKYSRPRSEAVIEVGTSGENDQGVIFVRDNGVGFNMKYADKLFGVFQRLHRSEDFEGTGVGLVTVQRIIHKHGGHVWAEAALDEGATFYFSIRGHKHHG